MNRVVCVLTSLLFLVVSLRIAGANASEGRSRVKIEWPSSDFRDLQSAINAAPDGALVQIKEGIYQINEPLFVRGKRLVITGAGSGQKRADRLTHLVGPPAQPVVDERGNLVLRAEAVQGLWNAVAADVVIQDMKLTGFNAGIVSKDDALGNSGPTEVKDVVIADTGRGVLSLSSSDMSIKDCTIMNTKWNGISFGPKLLNASLTTKAVVIIDPSGAGIYFEHAVVFIEDAVVSGASTGGIVGFMSSSFLHSSTLTGNTKAGILLQAGFSEIENNFILGTKALPSGAFGDGISLFASNLGQQSIIAHIFDNVIHTTDRAGISIFGGYADIGDNYILCAVFDVFAEQYAGFDFTLNDLGGNQCGCGSLTVCAATGEALEPPPPVGGLE